MVFPLIPVAIVAGGAAAGAGYSIFKKEGRATSKVTHAPYETYAPTKTLTYNPVNTIQYPDYNVQLHSPGANIETKKTQDVENKPSVDVSPNVSPVGSGDMDSGLDLLPIVLIAGVAYVLSSYLKKK